MYITRVLNFKKYILRRNTILGTSLFNGMNHPDIRVTFL